MSDTRTLAAQDRREVPAGARYGRWTVIAEAEKGNNHTRRLLCRCDCGKEAVVRAYNLTSGATRSCGCLSVDLLRQRMTVHGHLAQTADGKRPRLYDVWVSMRARCSNPRAGNFDRYGGRGIRICDEWGDYAVFHAWAMANGYRPGLSIDRVDNDGNYGPLNCRWATRKTQQRNMRTNRVIAYRGESRTLIEWSEVLGIARERLRARLRAGWSAERAFAVPRVGGG